MKCPKWLTALDEITEGTWIFTLVNLLSLGVAAVVIAKWAAGK
jgi:hypothetical protein